MLQNRPFVPISHGVRVSTAILSYNGRLFFGITGDYETAPDVHVLASATSNGIERLRSRVSARPHNAGPREARSMQAQSDST